MCRFNAPATHNWYPYFAGELARRFAFAGVLLAGTFPPLAAAGDLNVLGEDDAPSKIVYEHLRRQAHEALDRRLEEYERLKGPEDAVAYQQRRRRFFVEQLGGFPQRTPLLAETVGKLDGDGYRVEKVIFQSQPNHHVTATLYLPGDTATPVPGVVVASGHSRTGKAADYNQRFGIIMARHAMAALCYDPIGQGERSQFLDEQGQVKVRSTTQEHFLMGAGSILVGTNTARYRVYDGMRAIDYLAGRPEVDAKRIGFTGCSGGGTLTSYVMALDDRVFCAAPACYLTTFGRLIDTIGPQDAEQNIFGQIAFGMDQPDYVLMHAPKPTLISSTTGDFFDIRGSWENFRQAKRFYAGFGYPERVDLVEGSGGHGVPMGNLNAIARWMRRWLVGQDGVISQTDFPTRTTQELQCTPRGQVLLLDGERSIFELNAAIDQQLAKQRTRFWDSASGEQGRQRVRELTGIRPLEQLPKLGQRKVGSVKRDGYRIDKRVLETEPGLPLPALEFVPENPSGEVVLYLHGEGKHADAGAGGPIENLVADGKTVLAVDLRAIGETRGESANQQLGDWKNFYLAYLLGRSIVVARAEEVLAAAKLLVGDDAKPGNRVHLIAIGEAAIPALHAAALEPELFASARLEGMIASWSQLVTAGETHNALINTVHGVLRAYDLPNLLPLCDGVEVKLVQSR